MKKDRTNREGMTAKDWIVDILVAVVIAGAIMFFIKPTVVREISMEPNFYDGDYLMVYKMAYRTKQPEKGDVVIFRSELPDGNGGKKLLIKRVIGLPGDEIDIREGQVYVNGEKDDQSYTGDGMTTGEMEDHRVPAGKLFCMGDNRLHSRDSRDETVGDVDMNDVVGKAVFRAFPLNRFGTIRNPYK